MPKLSDDNTSRVDVSKPVDLEAIRTGIDYTNTMTTGDMGSSLDYIDTNKDMTAEAEATIAAMKRKPTDAEIVANKKEDAAILAAEMKKLELIAYAEELAMQKEHGDTVVYNDTSTRSTLNNTTQVSNALSVDASDLVAAKLNLMLPAFN